MVQAIVYYITPCFLIANSELCFTPHYRPWFPDHDALGPVHQGPRDQVSPQLPLPNSTEHFTCKTSGHQGTEGLKISSRYCKVLNVMKARKVFKLIYLKLRWWSRVHVDAFYSPTCVGITRLTSTPQPRTQMLVIAIDSLWRVKKFLENLEKNSMTSMVRLYSSRPLAVCCCLLVCPAGQSWVFRFQYQVIIKYCRLSSSLGNRHQWRCSHDLSVEISRS